MVPPAGPSGTHPEHVTHAQNQPKPIGPRAAPRHAQFQCNTFDTTGNQVHRPCHEESSQCGTWAPHGQHGWYVGAAPKHYRCYQIYIPKTQGTWICDTVEFFPTHCKMPKVSAHDAAIYAANDLIMALTKPQPTNSFISIGDDQLVALRQLATIFQTSITKKPISDPGGGGGGGGQTLHPYTQPNQETCKCSPYSTTTHHAIPHTTPTNH